MKKLLTFNNHLHLFNGFNQLFRKCGKQSEIC